MCGVLRLLEKKMFGEKLQNPAYRATSPALLCATYNPTHKIQQYISEAAHSAESPKGSEKGRLNLWSVELQNSLARCHASRYRKRRNLPQARLKF